MQRRQLRRQPTGSNFLMKCFFVWLFGSLFGCSVGHLLRWLVGWFVCFFVCWLVIGWRNGSVLQFAVATVIDCRAFASFIVVGCDWFWLVMIGYCHSWL